MDNNEMIFFKLYPSGDPDYFTVILRFLRTRKLDVSNGLQLTALYDEALFYSLDAVAEVIMRRITNPDQSGVGELGQ